MSLLLAKYLISATAPSAITSWFSDKRLYKSTIQDVCKGIKLDDFDVIFILTRSIPFFKWTDTLFEVLISYEWLFRYADANTKKLEFACEILQYKYNFPVFFWTYFYERFRCLDL